jgi:hypothetical protein
LKSILKKVIVLPLIIGSSLALFPKEAQALQWWEHMTGYAPNNSDQAAADSWCKSKVYSIIDKSGGTFSDSSHGGYISFGQFARPFVWAHLGYNRCIINASWGYVKWGGHS